MDSFLYPVRTFNALKILTDVYFEPIGVGAVDP